VAAGEQLASEGFGVRLVSMPGWEIFESQDLEYIEEVLPSEISVRVAVEAGVSYGWERWIGDHGVVLGVDRFGASAPVKIVYEKYGLTTEKIVNKTKELIG
jgi:transketolase